MAEKKPDEKQDQAQGAAAPPAITLEALGALREMFASDADKARALQVDAIRRQHEADDKAREDGGTVRVVSITSFTVYDNASPRGRLVRSGEEFDLARFDLEGMAGKVRLKELDAAPSEGGVKISAG